MFYQRKQQEKQKQKHSRRLFKWEQQRERKRGQRGAGRHIGRKWRKVKEIADENKERKREIEKRKQK